MNLETNSSVAGCIFNRLKSRGDEVVLTTEGQDITARQLLDNSSARQRNLKEAGVKTGNRVFITSGRGGLFWSDFLAVWGLGAVAIPLNPQISEKEYRHQVLKAEPDAIIGDLDSTDPGSLIRLPAEPDEAFVMLGVDPASIGQLNDEAAILFTSGSSGEPKGVSLSNRSVLGNAMAAASAIEFEPSDRLFIAIRFHFTSAICHFLASQISGGRLIATERSMIQAEFYGALVASGANAFGGAPIQLRWIAECHLHQPVSLRWVMSSGDRLSLEVIRDLLAVMPGTLIHTFYGLTELGGRFCSLPAEAIDSHAGSVGKPISGMHVRIVDEDGRSVPPNTAGEIVASGDYIFNGYINDEEKTSAVFDGTSLRTGDVGYLDADGMLYVEGRNDDVFKVSGRKVSANVVQHALMELGLFSDVAVIRFDHPATGSTARACFALREGAEFKRGKVLGELRKVLLKHYLPSVFTELEDIPRTGSGKLDRRALSDVLRRIDETV